MSKKTETSTFRLRGFECKACGLLQEVFGRLDPPPILCPCGVPAMIHQTFDDMVTVDKTVEPYDETKHG